MSVSIDQVPGQPTLVTHFTTATIIFIYWTISNRSDMDSYEVKWQRALSECSDVDEGCVSITDGSTSLAITGRQEDSSYSITVTATNPAGSAVSDTVTAVTGQAGYYLPLYKVFQKLYYFCLSCSSICCSHFCEYI